MIELRLWSPMPSPVSSPLPQPLWPAKGGTQVWEPGDALVSTTLDPLGSPLAHSGAQACVTLTNRTGFLCQDGSRCISASGVCDGIRTCSHGEDEAEALCREYLLSSAPFQMHPQGSLGGCPLIPSIPVAKLKLNHARNYQAFAYVVPSARNTCLQPHTHIRAHTRECLRCVHLHVQRTCTQTAWQSSSVTSTRKPSLTSKPG